MKTTNLSYQCKRNSTNSAGADLVSGIPADNLYSALLWYVVYKPSWNNATINSGWLS
jgi:hypothetical protein